MGFNEILTTIEGGVNHSLFSLQQDGITLKSILVLIVLVLGFAWLSRRVERFIHNTLLYKDIDPGIKGSMETFARYSILIVGILISLSTIGINFNSLTAFGALVGVGIGFGLQNITQNFMSGIIILMERPIKKGDIVKVGDTSGRILDIKARSTLVLTRDDVVMIVPNSDFITEQVMNDSFAGDKLRFHVDVHVAHGTDVDKVTDVLMEVAASHDKILKSPLPSVVLKDFTSSSLHFSLLVWSGELWFSELVLSQLRYEIVRQFRAHDITIPFPQRDLHIKSHPSAREA